MKFLKIENKQYKDLDLSSYTNKMIAHIASRYATNMNELHKYYFAGLEGLALAFEKFSNEPEKLKRFASWYVTKSIVELQNKPKTETELMVEKINKIFQHPIDEQSFEPIELPKVSRIEVIDNNGRSYVNWETEYKVGLYFQDGGRTLKLIIK
ncbi:MAG: hypothetical protein RL660_1130 [Bacteroidota bacterium]|jgi:hypothetical protein